MSSRYGLKWGAGCRRFRGSSTKRADDGVGEISICPISNRFTASTAEHSFVLRNFKHAEITVFRNACLAFIICLTILFLRYKAPPANETPLAAIVITCTWSFLLVWAVLTITLTKVIGIWRRLPLQAFEIYVVLTGCIIVGCQPFIDSSIAGDLASGVATDSSRHIKCSDSRMLPYLVVLVVSHFATPIRWCVVWVLEVVILFVYLLIYLRVGSCDGTIGFMYAFLGLVILIIVTNYGKRVAEFQERSFFFSYIHEKTLRCRTEFQLEQVVSCDHVAAKPDLACSGSSAPSTSPSDEVFEYTEQSHDNFVILGKREAWLVGDEELDVAVGENGLPQKLGSGEFAEVWAGFYQGSQVAIKTVAGCFGDVPLRAIFNEVRIMRRLRHPNIVHFYGACLDGNSSDFALVMELVTGIRLQDALTTDASTRAVLRVSEVDQLGILIDVSSALRYLHSRKPVVIHGDLKSSNIMLELQPHSMWCFPGFFKPKLLDFGLSRAVTSSARPLGGSVLWMCPEAVIQANGSRPRTSADVFSFGRLIQHVLTSKLKLVTEDKIMILGPNEVLRLLKSGKAPQPLWPIEAHSMLLSLCKDLGNACVTSDYALRPDMTHVRESLVAISMDVSLETVPRSLPECAQPPTKPKTVNLERISDFFEKARNDVSASVRSRSTNRQTKPFDTLRPLSLAGRMQLADVVTRFCSLEANVSCSFKGCCVLLLGSLGILEPLRGKITMHKCFAISKDSVDDQMCDESSSDSIVTLHMAIEKSFQERAICVRCGETWIAPPHQAATGASETFIEEVNAPKGRFKTSLPSSL